ncbi:putative mboat family protein [Botrytis cinerea BcDW1]|uniref:Putative mboat family protein n=1 Tax=Botryotinia fuckeliana (strain BcDW1) TaxID=1290391 RepID=M7U1E6_BOTF1|nr:putative mboat family protein [Botrytis cinerea BcDW1]
MTMSLPSDPTNPAQDSLDEQSRENGFDNSTSKQTPISPNRPKHSQSLKKALETVARNQRESSEVSESDSLEDYDTLKPDPMAIITRGKGGSLDTDMESSQIPQTVYAELKVQSPQSRHGTRRRKSIPVTLNKLQKNGQGIYTFEADDDELRDLLKGTVAHYAQDIASGEPKKRTKFSDCLGTIISLSSNKLDTISRVAMDTHKQYKTRSKLQRKLKQLDDISPIQTPSATTPAASSLSTSYLDARPTSNDIYQRVSDRRRSIVESATDQVAAAIDSGEPLDVDQVQTFARILKWEIDFLGKELEGKCTTTKNQYPNNLSLFNHYEYIVLPTLVYELEYPRSDDIDWYNVAEKSIATAGLLIVMNLISQTYIYPIVVKTIEMKESNLTSIERLRYFPGIVSDLAFPFLAEYILTWLLRSLVEFGILGSIRTRLESTGS